MDNFSFLKEIDKDLYELINEAQKLFCDGYFEQCMAQTRRFGENLCRRVMADRADVSDTFDEMLATLKDTPKHSEQEKEFLEDLYFLKKAGNKAVHSSQLQSADEAGKDALECLERSFEASINFAVYFCKADKKILNLVFDEQLLMTGKKSDSAKLQERYTAARKKAQSEARLEKTKKKAKKQEQTLEDCYAEYKKEKEKQKSKKHNKKSMLREIAETLLAGVIIYVVYLLFYNK